jgi:hypothetical protein
MRDTKTAAKISVSENVLFCCIPAIYGTVQRENV